MDEETVEGQSKHPGDLDKVRVSACTFYLSWEEEYISLFRKSLNKEKYDS